MSHLFEMGFTVREPAWHGLAEVLPEYPGREEAMRRAGHDHRILELGLRTEDGWSVPGWRALVRDDTRQVVSVMPSTYQVIQNDQAWDLVDAVVSAPDVRYETAGILGGSFAGDAAPEFAGERRGRYARGHVYWVLAHLRDPITVPGDPSPALTYVLCTWSHDGSQALRVRATNVRVICANTQAQALRSEGLDLSLRHRGDVEARLQARVAALREARDAAYAYQAVACELLALRATREAEERFVASLVPMPPAAEGLVVSDRVARNIEEAREAVRSILASPTCDGIRDTAWGLYQAGVEYLDHVRRYRSRSTYFRRNLLRTEPAKARLKELVLASL